MPNFIRKKCTNVLKKLYHLGLKGKIYTVYNKKGTLGSQAPISRKQAEKFLSYSLGHFLWERKDDSENGAQNDREPPLGGNTGP